MSALKKISEYFFYLKDSITSSNPIVKIDSFSLCDEKIQVSYRIGKHRLSKKQELKNFEEQFFELLSFYDKNRIIKYSNLEFILTDLFKNGYCDRERFLSYVEKELKNEQLF